MARSGICGILDLMNSVNLRQVPSVEKLVQAVAGAVGLPRRVGAGVARAEAVRIREQVVAGGEVDLPRMRSWRHAIACAAHRVSCQ